MIKLIRCNYEKVFREHFYSFRINTYKDYKKDWTQNLKAL